jgi:hypothetical protein
VTKDYAALHCGLQWLRWVGACWYYNPSAMQSIAKRAPISEMPLISCLAEVNDTPQRRKSLPQQEKIHMKTRHTSYAGQQARIIRAFQNHDGQMAYALKTASETIAVSKDKTLLMDIAEARYLTIKEIAD